MKLAILSRNANLYSTKKLVEAAVARGHEVHVLDHLKCYMVLQQGNPTMHYDGQELIGFDAVIPRIGASVTAYGAAIVRQFEMMRVFSAVKSQALVRSRDKLRSMQILAKEGLGMPITGFAHMPGDKSDLIQRVGGAPLILKLLEGTQGMGVVLTDSKKAAESVLDAFSGLDANLLIQEYIKEARGEDLRVFVVDNKIVASMLRKAKDGEFRSNLHRGGTSQRARLSKEERSAAISAAKALGLSIAGVDILRSKRGPLIIEVNSSPGLEGIEHATKLDIASKIIEFIERKIVKKNQPNDKIGA